MSKGKKQLLTVIGLLLLLAAMVCAYVFVPKGESDTSDEDGTKDTAANTVEVINIEKDKVSEISITLGAITDGKKQTKIHLKKEGDSWKFADDASIPVDSDQVDSLIGKGITEDSDSRYFSFRLRSGNPGAGGNVYYNGWTDIYVSVWFQCAG